MYLSNCYDALNKNTIECSCNMIQYIKNNVCTRVMNCFSAYERVILFWFLFPNDLHTSSSCLTHSVSVLLMTSQSIADDITMTRQFWRDHVNSDVDFIHDDIHNRSCKKK